MPTINARSWESFDKKVKETREAAEISAGRNVDFLFRGMSDSTLKLETTLERAGYAGGSVSDYCELILRAKPQIETFTGKTWAIADFPKVQESLRNYENWTLHRFPEAALYSCLVHLRHHGFPSPLLDWTRSPYVACYFAFRSDVKPKEGEVSIHAFWEQSPRLRAVNKGEPEIRSIGPYVTTHRRHYLQQSDYTMCVAFADELCFAQHEDAFARADPNQEVRWKFNIPWTERLKVLKLLDSYNLNAFSLFASEESLMETMALRELKFRDTDFGHVNREG